MSINIYSQQKVLEDIQKYQEECQKSVYGYIRWKITSVACPLMPFVIMEMDRDNKEIRKYGKYVLWINAIEIVDALMEI